METIRAMTGSEIARELGITRQAVSQTLRRGMEKLYLGIIDNPLVEGPWDACKHLIRFLGVDEEKDLMDFFTMFPEEIQKEIKKDAFEKEYRSH